MAKVAAYNTMAEAKVQETKTFEEQVNAVDGDNEARRGALIALEGQINQKREGVKELNAPYEELEQQELQLDAEHTPDSVDALYASLISHVTTLLAAIDSAIAQAKGLEISEEQLSEFRETFATFDKDHSNNLQYYELNACLTALGETASDDDCKEIIKKYCGEAQQMDFDNYVKFMLDRFSKAENKETTNEAFRALSQNSPVITEEQLTRYFSPEDVEFLKKELKEVEGGYDFASWVETLYAE